MAPIEPTIQGEEDELFSFPHMDESLNNVHKPPICADMKPLRSYLEPVIIDLESKGCSLASTICNIFPCQKKMFSCQTLSGLPKHVHFRLLANDPIHVNRNLSFLEFNFESTYIPGFDP